MQFLRNAGVTQTACSATFHSCIMLYFCRSFCVSVYLSTCSEYVHLSVCSYLCLLALAYVSFQICIHLSVWLSVFPSVCLSFYLPFCAFVYPFHWSCALYLPSQ